MTRSTSRLVALLAVLLFALAGYTAAEAQTSSKKKTSSKKSTTAKKKPAAKKPAAKKPAARKAAPPATAAAVGRTFEERLGSLINGSVARSADSSIQVVDVETGRVAGERNPRMPVAPASNMKLFTTAAAIDLLDRDFEITTPVYVRGEIDPSGTLQGDVKIVGRGDPTIGGRFHDGQATAVIQQWASDLKRAGIKNIRGNLVFEYGYFDTEYVHPTWPKDQLVNWYEAPIASLSMQEGCVAVRVLPSRPGTRCVVQLEPPTNFITVENSCTTGSGLPFINRKIGTNTVIVRGGVPSRSGTSEVFVTVENPVHYFASVTTEAFARSGLKLDGEVQIVPRDARTDWRLVTKHSTPLSIVVYVINKKSQNQYAEQLLKILGAEKGNGGTWTSGARVISDWAVNKAGVPAAEFAPVDGSGMSRNNRASAYAFIQILRYMWRTPGRQDFVSSMPYTGDPDSKFGNRLKQAPYARQVYAKTGYIGGVIGLSGYVHAKSGKVYAFSFLFNRYRVGVYAIYRLQDEMLKEIIDNG